MISKKFILGIMLILTIGLSIGIENDIKPTEKLNFSLDLPKNKILECMKECKTEYERCLESGKDSEECVLERGKCMENCGYIHDCASKEYYIYKKIENECRSENGYNESCIKKIYNVILNKSDYCSILIKKSLEERYNKYFDSYNVTDCNALIEKIKKETKYLRPVNCGVDPKTKTEFCSYGPVDNKTMRKFIDEYRGKVPEKCLNRIIKVLSQGYIEKHEPKKTINKSCKDYCKTEYERCLNSYMTQECIRTPNGKIICSNEEKCRYRYEICLKTCKNYYYITQQKTTNLEEIIKNPKDYVGKNVLLNDLIYVGWKESCNYSEPITKSDVVVKDSNGYCIYIEGPQLVEPFGNKYYSEKVKVIGKVVLNDEKPIIKGRIIPIKNKIITSEEIKKKIKNIYELKKKFEKGQIDEKNYVENIKDILMMYLNKLENIIDTVEADNNTYLVITSIVLDIEDLKTKIQLVENYTELKTIYHEVRKKVHELKNEIKKLKIYSVLMKVSEKIKNEKISEKIKNIAIKVLNGEIKPDKKEILKNLRS